MQLNNYIKKSRGVMKSEGMKELKIAFLANFTITGLAEALKVKCFEEEIFTQTYVSPYNQYVQEILNDSSELYRFAADIIFVVLDKDPLLENFCSFPYHLNDKEREKFIKQKFDEVKDLILKLKKTTAKIVVNNLTIPDYSSRGILESKENFGVRKCIRYFNDLLELQSKNDPQLFIFDFNLFSSKIGYKHVFDEKLSYMGDMRVSPDALVELSTHYLAYILPLVSLNKKCMVLDLDNTLWGGVIGEDGLAGIKLGPDTEGRPFLNFQKRILELFERGIIMAINSKNNPEDVRDVFNNHPYMLLKEHHFACIKTNWQDKATNMLEIAKELNIGLDSLVFLDDDKTNRELIRKIVPEVAVIDLPEDPVLYTKTIEELNLFSTFNLTEDDTRRGEMYIQQIKRKEFEASFSDVATFLRQLNIKLTINNGDKENSARISQLTQKTNQFNLTTKRYLEEDIINFIGSANSIIKYIKVGDRFGDYGITGVIIINKDESEWEIDTFLLSCRILGKNIEFSLMENIIEEALSKGVSKLSAKFIPSKKNIPAKNFLSDCGFELIQEKEAESFYVLDVKKWKKRDFDFIDIIIV